MKNGNKVKKEQKNEIQKEKKSFTKLYIKIKYLTNDSSLYKAIFREYRSLKIIGSKSEYIIRLQNIQLNNDNSKIKFSFKEEGVSLYDLINTTVFDYREEPLIRWILFQILKGLETMHSLNIIHRDINPSHILISSKGGIKITGLGRSINDIESKFIVDKVVGLLNYIAPECFLELNYNNKIDIWAVGILMLELYYKKTNIINNNENNDEDNNPHKYFKQFKYLANFFKIPFNFDENNYNKDQLISWLHNLNDNISYLKLNEILKEIPDLGEDGIDLLRRLLCFNPKLRISAKEALKMDYFKSYRKFNTDEFKKSKSKQNNEDLSPFLKNLEKEFPKIDIYPQEKKIEIFKKEISQICKYKLGE